MKIYGYASLFNIKDLSGDIVRPGAFSKSLKNLEESFHALPMLPNHNVENPMGIWNVVYEDLKGLYVEGELLVADSISKQWSNLSQSYVINGLSIGFRTVKSRKVDHGRILTELELWEV